MSHLPPDTYEWNDAGLISLHVHATADWDVDGPCVDVEILGGSIDGGPLLAPDPLFSALGWTPEIVARVSCEIAENRAREIERARIRSRWGDA